MSVPDYLVSLDVSSTAIGYTYFLRGDLVACGSVRSNLTTVQARIVDLIAKLEEVFPEFGDGVRCVMEWSEGRSLAFLKKNGRSSESSVPLAHAQGAVFWWLCKRGVEPACVGDLEWTASYGKMSKSDRAAEIHRKYPEFRDVWREDAKGERHDAADAVEVGEYHIAEARTLEMCSRGRSLRTNLPKGG